MKRCYLMLWVQIFYFVIYVNSQGVNGFNKLKIDESSPTYFSGNPLLQSLKKYHVFIPHQFEDIGHKRKKRDLSTELKNATGLHFRNTYFTVDYYGKKYVLDLSINQELLPRSFATGHDDGVKLHMQKPSRQEMNHCYYQGTVRGIEDSLAVMNTCKGLRGSIILPGEFLLVEPLSNDPNTALQGGSHVIYRHSDLKNNKPSGSCGNDDAHDKINSFVSKLQSLSEFTYDNHTRRKRATGERKFVELMVVADRLEAKKYPNRVNLHDRIKDIVNHVDAFYGKLGIRVVLSYIEVWTPPNGGIEISSNAGEALNQFSKYRLQRSKKEPSSSAWNYADNFHLLYGGDFDGSTIGMASVGTMCGPGSNGVNQDHSSNTVNTAATVAHEMGHNFGMYHDTPTCKCPENAQCIMAASAGFRPDREWSSCSKEYLAENLKFGIKSCIGNVPDPSRIYGGPHCGNDIVEEGEECDCGPPEFCTSKCCNATSCQLLPGATCDVGVCCNDCQFLKAGTECRSTKGNDCDLSEYCTGLSPNCPMDVFIENGSPCLQSTAVCHEGVCLTYDMQCASIWGPGATSGVDACYVQVNRLGNVNGNCGRNDAGSFIKCTQENAKCGKLLCQGGKSYPVIGSDRTSYINTVTSNGVQSKCRTIQSDAVATDMSDPGLVRSGTMCDKDKVCQEGICTDIPPLVCSQKCNGNGVCNNRGNCHCDPGWAPPFCDSEGNGGSMDSGPINDDRVDIQVVLLLVLCLVVLPLILGAGTFVWFRYCGGRKQVQTWKHNRERRLSAVRKVKKGGGNMKTRHVSASKENLVSTPSHSIVHKNNFNSWNESTNVSSPVPYVDFAKPSSHAPPSRPAPPRPPPASASSVPSKPPPMHNKPTLPPTKPTNSSNGALRPSYPSKPPLPTSKPPGPPQSHPARSAPPPPRPLMQNSTNTFSNSTTPIKPTVPKQPPVRAKPALNPKPKPASTDSTAEMSVMERARRFNAL